LHFLCQAAQELILELGKSSFWGRQVEL